MSAPLLRLNRVSKSYLSSFAVEDIFARGRSRRGPLPSRGQRPGKIHPHQDPVRCSQAFERHDGDRGHDGQLSSAKDASEFGIATGPRVRRLLPAHDRRPLVLRRRRADEGLLTFKRFDTKKAADIAVREVQRLGITHITSGDQLVGSLYWGERQALVIARAVHFGAKVLILDEPTAALGVKEATHVLRIIMQARAEGIAVIFVTHNVLHATTVGDRFAVLIHGEKADDFRRGERTRGEITDLMAGGEAMAELEAQDRRLLDVGGLRRRLTVGVVMAANRRIHVAPAVVIDRAGPLPLYFQIATSIEQSIVRGDFPHAARLENEVAMAMRLGLSLQTVRRAIEILVEKGLLVRRSGVGTLVLAGFTRRRSELTSLHDQMTARSPESHHSCACPGCRTGVRRRRRFARPRCRRACSSISAVSAAETVYRWRSWRTGCRSQRARSPWTSSSVTASTSCFDLGASRSRSRSSRSARGLRQDRSGSCSRCRRACRC